MKRHVNKITGSVSAVALAAGLAVAAGTGLAPQQASAQDGPVCTSPVRILAQPRDGLTLLEQYAAEFEELSGASFHIDYLNEGDRRVRSQADASMIGRYNVYYVDEANLAQFASSCWIAPLLDHYPEEFDFFDFDPGRIATATYDDTIWFAPILGGGDLMVYRKDLLEAAGIAPPTTLEELQEAVAALHDPENGIFGIGLRGQRGSGANVWRWMPYFKGMGGEWFVDDAPAMNSEAAVMATQTYLDLFEFSAPGTRTGSWDESTGAFRAGQIAIIIESAPLGGIALDSSQSQVADLIGFAKPPAPLTGGGFAHGFAIGERANATDAEKDCAGLWIAWATSKEQEERRLAAGQAGELNRVSIFESDAFVETFGAELPAALAETAEVTAVNFWQHANWPELGNQWGILLEELITGTRTDIEGALAELESFAANLTN